MAGVNTFRQILLKLLTCDSEYTCKYIPANTCTLQILNVWRRNKLKQYFNRIVSKKPGRRRGGRKRKRGWGGWEHVDYEMRKKNGESSSYLTNGLSANLCADSRAVGQWACNPRVLYRSAPNQSWTLLPPSAQEHNFAHYGSRCKQTITTAKRDNDYKNALRTFLLYNKRE